MEILKHTATNVFREQIHLLFAGSMIPILFSLAGAGLLCCSVWEVVGHTYIVVWMAVFVSLSLVRMSLVWLFNRQETTTVNEQYWYRRFLISTYAIAVVWGSAAYFLFPEHSPSHEVMFIMVLVGMASGGVFSLYPSLPMVIGFVSLLLLPLCVKMLTFGTGGEGLLKGLLVSLFWAVILIGAIKINRNLRENIQLRLQSVDREKNLKLSEQRYRHIFLHAPLGIFHYDPDSIIVDCNKEFVRTLGTSRELLIGIKMIDVLREQQMLNAVNDSLLLGEGYYEGDYTSVTAGVTTPVRAFFKAIHALDQSIIGGVGIVEDFTEKKLTEEQIEYFASYDSLTGLPNRRLLLEYLNNEMARSKRHGHYGALLFLDLDNFKTINDSLGHSVGDELLKVVARRISECIRREDTAARMGGDEFIIIITELDRSIGLAAHKVRGIAEELCLCLSAPCKIEGRELQITPSVGVSLFPKEGKDVDDILKQADTAMYRAKAAGRNSIHFFLPTMQDAADERLRLNTEIRKALEEKQFILYYQPQVNISGKLVGAEALIRWLHPTRGIVPPGAFLETAEEAGLMQEIGQWVLRETCRNIKLWKDKGLLDETLTISINISGKEIVVADFVATVTTVLNETKADPHHLGIELTEGSLVSTGSDIVQKIKALQQMGIKFSVDDFGTGYSSLSYLQSLPLNTLKIDRSFVNDIKDASHAVILVDTIIMMAHNLGLEVIAEGVETREELDYLHDKGCTVYQGYYFSKPLPLESFTKMLESIKLETMAV